VFDIGFWEIAVIGVIALLVVGPERLPAVARNAGRWVGRMRRYISHVKQDIEREIHADEVRQLLEEPEGLESIGDVARETAAVLEDTRKELNSVVNDAQAAAGADIPAAGDRASGRRAPGQASDVEPFAPSSIASVSPGEATVSPDESCAPPTPPAEDTDAATTSDFPADEQRPEQPGQR
jgi:sec-independent protein translocase protein TatB